MEQAVQRGLEYILASVFPVDVGMRLIYTCKAFAEDETLLRAALFSDSGAGATAYWSSLFKRSTQLFRPICSLYHFKRIARMIATRPDLHWLDASKVNLGGLRMHVVQLAFEAERYDCATALVVQAGFAVDLPLQDHWTTTDGYSHVKRVYGGSSIFGPACSAAGSTGSLAARELCVALAEHRGREDGTLTFLNAGGLHVACATGAFDAVSTWLSLEPAGVASLIHVQAGAKGHTPFTAACEQCTSHMLSNYSRAQVAHCALALATLPECVPGGRGGGFSYLHWVCHGGRVDVLQLWLARDRAAVLAAMNVRNTTDEPLLFGQGHTPFTSACDLPWPGDLRYAVRATARDCAALLASLPGCRPEVVGGAGLTYDYWASKIGLTLRREACT